MSNTTTSKAAKMDLQPALQRFGLTSFRKGQREVINHVIDGNDCLCVMPTGGGKSLCYQLPSVVRKGLTIVVSPLIALMKDQVDTLAKRGISATLINSTLSQSEQNKRLDQVARGHFNLLYVAPERLRNPHFQDAIKSTPVQLLAIDEAHCISEWGHDFRPDYQRVGRFREALGGVQTIALTATATPRVRQDIVDSLKLKVAKHFVTGFARDNLFFGVTQTHSDREKDKKLIELLETRPGSGIIYAATRKRCEALVEMVSQELKMSVGAYHAGLAPEQRKLIQDQFMSGQLEVIVATNAFGMGIDKQDLRYVVHYNMPGTIEAYYQEAGRAGRDGHSSQCLLLYSAQDRYIQEFFIENANPSKELLKSVYEFLHELNDDPIELTAEQIREQMNAPATSEAINSALQILARTDVLERLEVAGGLAMVRINSKLPTLVDLLPKEATVKRKVLRAVEKAVGDRREESVYINPRLLMRQLEMERDALSRYMRELTSLPGFEYVPPFRGRAIHFRQKGVAFDQLKIDHATLEARKRSDYEKLDQMVSFAQSRKCRQGTILHYFGDTSASKCNICDRCQGKAGLPTIPDDRKAPPPLPKTENTTQKLSPAIPAADTTLKPEASVQATPQADKSAKSTSKKPKKSSSAAEPPSFSPAQLEEVRALIRQVLGAIERTHGYLSKTILAQFFSGLDNRAIQGLRLQRLPDYGALKHWKKTHVSAFLELLVEKSILNISELRAGKSNLAVSPFGLECIHGISPLPEDVVKNASIYQFQALGASTSDLTSSNPTERDQSPSTSNESTSNASKAGRSQDRLISKPSPLQGEVAVEATDDAKTESRQVLDSGAKHSVEAKHDAQEAERTDASEPEIAIPPKSRVSEQNHPQQQQSRPRLSNTTPDGSSAAISNSLILDDILTAPQLSDASKVRDPLIGTVQDWEWSVRLVQHGYRLGEVALIRGKHPDQILADLCHALEAGKSVPMDQLFDKRTQITIREVGNAPANAAPPLAFASFPKLWDFARLWNAQTKSNG